MNAFVRKLLWLKQRKRKEDELREEIQFHLDEETEEFKSDGLPVQEARWAAHRSLGNISLVNEEVRNMWGWVSIERFLQDLHFGLRTLQKNAVFSMVTIATLAFGIGANTAIFSLVDHVILRPLAYRNAEGLYAIHEHLSGAFATVPPIIPVNGAHFSEWRKSLRSFDEMALLGGISMSLTGTEEPQRLNGARVSWNLFELLGVRPLLGRTFLRQEDAVGKDHEVILNYGLWKSRFAGNPDVIGQKMLLDGEPYEIIGVLPASFRFPRLSQLFAMDLAEQRPEFWKPFALHKDEMEAVGDFNFACIARLNQNASAAQAQTELNALQGELAKQVPFHVNFSAVMVPLDRQITSRARTGLKLSLAAVTLLLLIACVNLASLLLARGTVRKREMAIRIAIGASRARLFLQILTENLTLAMIGGAVGIAVAYAAVRVIVAYAPVDAPRIEEVGIDRQVLLFTLGISIFAGILFGLMPAWNAAREDPQDAMKTGGRGSTEARSSGRARSVLVGVEVCLSATCLVLGGLLLHSFAKLLKVDRGFEVQNLVTVDLELPENRYPTEERRAIVLKDLIDRIQELPDVKQAAVANRVPLTGEGENGVVDAAGTTAPLTQRPLADIRTVSPNYFRTIGIGLQSGRVFTDGDRTRAVALISAITARKIWPAQNPLGHELIFGDDTKHPIQVLGVVGDVRGASLEKQPAMTVYLPYWQRSQGEMTLVAKTRASESTTAREMRTAIQQVDRQLPIEHFQTMAARLGESVAQRRFQMQLIALFAICALVLVSIGIYGVVAYSVAQRKNEIGIRLALGAQRRNIGHMVFWGGLQPVLIGLIAGVIASLIVGRTIEKLLFGVTAADPVTIAGVVALLLIVAIGALILPALRAIRVNSLDALRYE